MSKSIIDRSIFNFSTNIRKEFSNIHNINIINFMFVDVRIYLYQYKQQLT